MYSTSTDHRSDKIQIFYGKLRHFAKIVLHGLLVEFQHVFWYFLWQWWPQCFLFACSAQRKRSLLIAIPFNEWFCNKNFKIKKENGITNLRIHNLIIHNGNVDGMKKYPQIKSDFFFYNLVDMQPFFINNINTAQACIVHFYYIWARQSCPCGRAFSSSHHVWGPVHSFNICC